MRDMPLPISRQPLAVRSFLACVATVLEMPIEQLPQPSSDGDPATGWVVSRWLGVRLADRQRMVEATVRGPRPVAVRA